MAVKTFYLRTNSAGSQPSGGKTWTIEESSGSGNNSSTIVSVGKTAATNKFLFQPGNDNNTGLGTSYPSGIQKYGWVTTQAYSGVFSSGNWNFYNRIANNQASTEKGKIAVRVYRVTAQNLSGTNTVISPTGAGNGWNESAEQTLSVVQDYDVTWAVSFAQATLASEYVYVEYIWNITTASGKTAQDVALYAESAYPDRIVTTSITELKTNTYTLDTQIQKLGFVKTYSLDTIVAPPPVPGKIASGDIALSKGQNRIVFRNPRGLQKYYAFYRGSDTYLYYEWSDDGVNWGNSPVLLAGELTYGFDVAVHDTGTQLMVCIVLLPVSGPKVYYRRNPIPDTDYLLAAGNSGTVTTTGKTLTGNPSVSIAHTPVGRYVIAFTTDTSLYRQTWIMGSTGDTGALTWTGGTVWNDPSGSSNNQNKDQVWCGVYSLTGMYPSDVLLAGCIPNSYSASAYNAKFDVLQWDGASFTSYGTYSTTSQSVPTPLSGVVDSNDISFIMHYVDGTGFVCYKSDAAESVTSGTTTTIVSDSTNSACALSIDTTVSPNILYAFYAKTSDSKLYYRTSPTDTVSWSDEQSISTNGTSAITAISASIKRWTSSIQIVVTDGSSDYYIILTPLFTKGYKVDTILQSNDNKPVPYVINTFLKKYDASKIQTVDSSISNPRFSWTQLADDGVEAVYGSESCEAVYYDGHTYITFGKSSNESYIDPWVADYNHSTGAVTTARVVVNSGWGDNHGYPAITVDNSGYIHVFFGGHNSPEKHYKSTNVKDISAWTAMNDVGDYVTYHVPFVVGSTMYLFYRETVNGIGNDRPLVVQTSTDGGSTWSAYTTIIQGGNYWIYHGGIDRNSSNGRFYIAWQGLNNGTAFTGKNFFLQWDPSNGHCYTMSGTDLGTSVTAQQSECLMYDFGSVQDVSATAMSLDSNQIPYMIMKRSTGSAFYYTLIYWTGSAFTSPISIVSTLNGEPVCDLRVFSSTDIDFYITTDSNEAWQGSQAGHADRFHWNGSTVSFAERLASKELSAKLGWRMPTVVWGGSSGKEPYGRWPMEVLVCDDNWWGTLPLSDPTCHAYVMPFRIAYQKTIKLDVIFEGGAAQKNQSYTSDVLLKKLGVTSTYQAQAFIKKLNLTKGFSVEVMIKKLGALKPYSLNIIINKISKKEVTVDSLIKKLSITKTYTSNVFIKKSFTKPYSSDTYLKKMGFTKPYTIESLIKKLGATKANQVDSIFIGLAGEKFKTYIADSLFKILGRSKTYGTNTRLYKAGELGIGFVDDPLQRKTYYANGRYWVFYVDSNYIIYQTSTDGTTWGSPSHIRNNTGGDYGYNFVTAFDGTYLHYAYSDRNDNSPCYYRRGTLETNGSITWSAAEQTAMATASGAWYGEIAIDVDTSGRPIISYEFVDAGSDYPRVTRSSSTDGTWTTDTGFPIQLDNTYGIWWTSIVSLTNNRFYVIAQGPGGLHGWLYDGSLGSREDLCNNTEHFVSLTHTPSTDVVHIGYFNLNTTNYTYRKRDGTWGNEEIVLTIAGDSIDSNDSESLSSLTNGEVYVTYTRNSRANIYYKKRSTEGTWGSGTSLVTGASVYTNNLTGYLHAMNNEIGVVYSKSSSTPPYIVYFSKYAASTQQTRSKDYIIDSLLKKLGISKTYIIGAFFRKLGLTKTFAVSTGFATTRLKTYTANAYIKKLGAIKTYSSDALFGLGVRVKTYDVGTFLKKNDVTKTYIIDAFLRKLGFTKTFSVNSYILKTIQKTYVSNVYLKKFGVIKPYSLDSLFLAPGVKTKGYSANSLFKKLGFIKTATYDTLFQTKNKVKTVSTNTIFVNRKAKTYLSQTFIKKFSVTTNYLINTIVSRHYSQSYQIHTLIRKLNIIKSYALNTFISITRTTPFIVSSIIREPNAEFLYTAHTIFRKYNVGKNYNIDANFVPWIPGVPIERVVLKGARTVITMSGNRPVVELKK